MTVRFVIGWLLCCILGLISLIYLYWALGGLWGKAESSPIVDGKPLVSLSPVQSFSAAWISFLLAAVPVVSMRPLLRKGLLIAIVVAFSARAIGDFRYFGFFKSERGSLYGYWDTRLYSPAALLIVFLAILLIVRI